MRYDKALKTNQYAREFFFCAKNKAFSLAFLRKKEYLCTEILLIPFNTFVLI